MNWFHLKEGFNINFIVFVLQIRVSIKNLFQYIEMKVSNLDRLVRRVEAILIFRNINT